ncbi:MAG: DsbA family protein [Lactobacillales bacterium]|nr:DsbA family protein [Lactobacillales bacterium]
MLEIFVFCGPEHLCDTLIEDELRASDFPFNTPLRFSYIPVINNKYVSRILAKQKMVENVDNYNQIYRCVYNLALDIKAIQVQGNKCLKNFMHELYRSNVAHDYCYTRDEIEEILERIGADLEAFWTNRNSDWVRSSLATDQQIVQKYHIDNTPSVAVFSETYFGDQGYILHDCDAGRIIDLIKNYKRHNRLGDTRTLRIINP